MTKTVTDLEIFSTGTHTDSMGTTVTMDGAALDKMVQAFDSGEPWRPAVKLGHTSDEYNELVAAALEVPVEALTGDDEGGGVIALGEIVKLERKQNKLVATIEVPDELASMIDKGFLRDVSSEMILNDDGDWIVSGLALLGAEAPAVDDLRGLSAAAVLSNKDNPQTMKPAHAFSRKVPRIVFVDGIGVPIDETAGGFTKLVEAVKRRLGKASEDNMSKHVKFSQDDLVELKLREEDDDDQDEDEVKASIAKLTDDRDKMDEIKAAMASLTKLLQDEEEDDDEVEEALADDADPEEVAARAQALISRFKKRAASSDGDTATAIKLALQPLQKQITELQSAEQTAKFRSRVEALVIPGTTDELLKQLEDLPEKAAESVLETWETSSAAFVKQGITKPIGRAKSDGDDDEVVEKDIARDAKFEAEVFEYMNDNGVDKRAAENHVHLNSFLGRREPEESVKA